MQSLQNIWQSIYENSGCVYDYGVFVALSIVVAAMFLAAFAGCVIPVVPGPALAFCGVLLWKFALANDKISWICVLICLALTVIAQLLDWWLPVKYTPTKRGAWGAFLGVLAGVFLAAAFPPAAIFAIFFSPFVFAFALEYSDAESDFRKALKTGTGAFVGTILGAAAKAAIVLIMLFAAALDCVLG
ncbi:MAG: DUF456 domain-containing protein [Opitutales bacterium]|nr:DUF456 domain-containing protein [Opitutales bacterium]